jgi:Zn-dependent protease with chaperone function
MNEAGNDSGKGRGEWWFPVSMDGPPLRSFAGISPSRFQHPGDATTLRAIRNFGGIEGLVRLCNEHYHERVSRLDNLVRNIRVSPRQLPELHALFMGCCERLGVSPETELYVGHEVNAWTSGSEQPYVAIGCELLTLLTPEELQFVLGHELGHIVMQHSPFHQVAQWSLGVAADSAKFACAPLADNLLSSAMRLMLLRWFRLSEFSADRTGLAACQDITAASRALMKLSGYPLGFLESVNLDGCVEQAQELAAMSDDAVNLLLRFAGESSRTHPWTIVRVGELYGWYTDGDYAGLLEGAPVTASAEPARVWLPPPAGFRCPVCRRESAGHNRFCPGCGAPLGERDRLRASEGEETASGPEQGAQL